MKLWQVKASALRIMFADSDINFNEEEFTTGVLEENPNTNEKLIRMNNSISRGIDKYYQIVGQRKSYVKGVSLKVIDDVKQNYIDLTDYPLIDHPLKIDAVVFVLDEEGEVLSERIFETIEFIFDIYNQRVEFAYGQDLTEYDLVNFNIHYENKKSNLPVDAHDITFDLDTLFIPEDVQRMLCYFVKGELYEEDNDSLARVAMNNFYSFLYNYKKIDNNYSQRKVKRAKVFNKTN